MTVRLAEMTESYELAQSLHLLVVDDDKLLVGGRIDVEISFIRMAILIACSESFMYRSSVNSASNCKPISAPLAMTAPCCFWMEKKCLWALRLVKTTASPQSAPIFVPPM